MPRVRHITSLLSSPLFAMDMRAGSKITGLLASNEGGELLQTLERGGDEARDAKWYTTYLIESGQFPYYVNPDGSTVSALDPEVGKRVKSGAVAVLPMKGVMVKEAWDIEELVWGLCSSARIAQEVAAFEDDARVAGIVLNPYTPGGMVYGTEGVGEAVKAAAGSKPVIACVDHLATSAGYWDICHATEVRLMGRTSEVGSIGVVTAWMDFIGYFEKEGAKFRMHFAPESTHKWEETRALLQKDDPKVLEQSMSATAKLFQATVREGRQGKLSEKDDALLAGRVYEGDAAIAAGLADGYGSLADCIDAVRRQAGVSAKRSPGSRAAAEEAPLKEAGLKSDPSVAARIEDFKRRYEDVKKFSTEATSLNTTQPETDNPKTMSKIAKVVAAVAAALGFDQKEEVTESALNEANAALAEKGITGAAFVSTAEQQRLADAAKQVADAKAAQAAAESAQATAEGKLAGAQASQSDAEGKLATVTAERDATKTALEAAATKHGLEVKEGENAADVVVAALAKATEDLATANAEITKLKGEEAPDNRPDGVVNKKGDVTDNGAGDEALKALGEFAKTED